MRTHRIVGTPFVFPGERARRPFADITRLWDTVRQAAKVSDLRVHDLRHGFASVGGLVGLSLETVGKLLGHSNNSSTAKYTHYFDAHLREAADLVSSRIAAALTGGSLRTTVEAGKSIKSVRHGA